MDGIILINKEEKYTSQDVCNVIKKIFNTSKVGHCGTLDPFATGLMIIGINQGTKILRFLENSKKKYLATIKFGASTDTYDKDGKIIATSIIRKLTINELNLVIKQFLGEQEQIPPIYSAIKVGGKKLYEYARKNKSVDIPKRKIFIYDIKIIYYDIETLKLEIECSKGTYIRSLANDLSHKLGMEGHLINLCRTKVDNFDIKDSIKLEELKNKANNVIKISDALSFTKIVIESNDLKKVINGVKMNFDFDDKYVLCMDKDQNPIAIYEKEENYFKCLRGFVYEN